jgi:hypothetical protein
MHGKKIVISHRHCRILRLTEADMIAIQVAAVPIRGRKCPEIGIDLS